jgi:hypothetical protein
MSDFNFSRTLGFGALTPHPNPLPVRGEGNGRSSRLRCERFLRPKSRTRVVPSPLTGRGLG